MASEDFMEELSHSADSSVHDSADDSSYEMSSDSADEDFSVPQPAVTRNRNGRQKSSRGRNLVQESFSSSAAQHVFNDKTSEIVPQTSTKKPRPCRKNRNLTKKRQQNRALLLQPGNT